jgi:hypothetical protein
MQFNAARLYHKMHYSCQAAALEELQLNVNGLWLLNFI